MAKGALIVLMAAAMAMTHPGGRRQAAEWGRGARERALHCLGLSASLRFLSVVESDFRGNDRDSSKVNDFWTADVGLYAPSEETLSEVIRLLEISVAGVEDRPVTAGSPNTLSSADVDFRGGDQSGNRIQDFWTADVAGLYGSKAVPHGPSGWIIRLWDWLEDPPHRGWSSP